MDEATAAAGPRAGHEGRDGGRSSSAPTTAAATYESWSRKGVEFTEEPTERPYGIDCALRDPFGNHIRITQHG